jgi:hypothetical protein
MVPEVKVDFAQISRRCQQYAEGIKDMPIDYSGAVHVFLTELGPILEHADQAIASLPQIATAHAEQAVIQAQGQIAQVARMEARAYRSGDRGPCTAATALENFAASLERSADKMAGKQPAPAPKKGLILL